MWILVGRVEVQRGHLGTSPLAIIEGCPFLTVWDRCIGTCDHRVQFFLLRLNGVDALVVVSIARAYRLALRIIFADVIACRVL